MQPEVIFVWFLLDKCEFKLIENWETFFDEAELELIKNAWCVIEQKLGRSRRKGGRAFPPIFRRRQAKGFSFNP